MLLLNGKADYKATESLKIFMRQIYLGLKFLHTLWAKAQTASVVYCSLVVFTWKTVFNLKIDSPPGIKSRVVYCPE